MIDAPASVPVRLGGDRDYEIRFQSLQTLPSAMSDAGLRLGRCILVTDEHVGAHYRRPVLTTLEAAGWSPFAITVPAGETSKSFEQLQAVYDEVLEHGIDRQTPVVALGGGVVGDLAGYAAASLLRGIPVVQCPTSLIAQVDSALGGKTGINHKTGKNLIGAFHQPSVVVTDFDTLGTLPQREWTSGMAEVVKHAIIGDADLFSFIDDHLVGLMTGRDRPRVQQMIPRAVRVKADIVSADERESGRRAILNFGHTFGHAVESVAGYGRFTHGEAVAVGMRAALHLSARRHPETVPLERIDHVVQAIPQHHGAADLEWSAVRQAMQSDKKNTGSTVRCVLIDRIGHAYIAGDLEEHELRQAWEFATHA